MFVYFLAANVHIVHTFFYIKDIFLDFFHRLIIVLLHHNPSIFFYCGRYRYGSFFMLPFFGPENTILLIVITSPCHSCCLARVVILCLCGSRSIFYGSLAISLETNPDFIHFVLHELLCALFAAFSFFDNGCHNNGKN